MRPERLNIDDTATRLVRAASLANSLTWWLLLCVLAPASALAQTGSASQALEFAAREALQQQWHEHDGRIDIQIANLDPRLQIPVCPAPLETEVRSQNPNGGRVTVRITCTGEAPWTRHIAATVDIYRDVIVARSALSRGARLAAADLSTEERNISQLRGRVYSNATELLGMELQRSLAPGTPLTDALIQEPVLVKRGETVVLTATRGNVSIRQTATAMQDGRKGQQISVRNNSSERTIQAIVTGTGEADVVF